MLLCKDDDSVELGSLEGELEERGRGRERGRRREGEGEVERGKAQLHVSAPKLSAFSQ